MRHFLTVMGVAAFALLGTSACSPAVKDDSPIRIRWAKDIDTIETLLTRSAQSREVSNLLHCSLLTLDAASRKMVPMLAQALPEVQEQDSLIRLTYTLRPEAAWDNGQPVLASDVAYTLRMMNCPGLPTELVRLSYGTVQDFELDPANPRRITLVCAGSSVEELLIGSGDFNVLPESELDPAHSLRAFTLQALRKAGESKQSPPVAVRAYADRYKKLNQEKQQGCGAYRISQWTRGARLDLDRKENWWGERLTTPPAWLQARAKKLSFHVVPDAATAMLALRDGTLDVYPMPAGRDYVERQNSRDTLKLLFRSAGSYRMISAGFNTEKPLFRDAATRRALTLLFNVDGLMKASQPGLSYRSVGLINPLDTAAYNKALPLLPFAPDQARKELLAAGWKPRADRSLWRAGQRLAFSLTYVAGNKEHELIGLQLRSAAASIGVVVNLLPLEGATASEMLSKGEMEMYLQNLTGSPVSYDLRPLLHSSGISFFNLSRFRNAAMDQLLDSITAERSYPRRMQQVRRFQALTRQEAPVVVLYFLRNRLIASRRLANVQALTTSPGYAAAQFEPVRND